MNPVATEHLTYTSQLVQPENKKKAAKDRGCIGDPFASIYSTKNLNPGNKITGHTYYNNLTSHPTDHYLHEISDTGKVKSKHESGYRTYHTMIGGSAGLVYDPEEVPKWTKAVFKVIEGLMVFNYSQEFIGRLSEYLTMSEKCHLFMVLDDSGLADEAILDDKDVRLGYLLAAVLVVEYEVASKTDNKGT